MSKHTKHPDTRYVTLTGHQVVNAARTLQRNGQVKVSVRGYLHEGRPNKKKPFEQMCETTVAVEAVGRLVTHVSAIPLLTNPEYMIDLNTGHAQDRLIIKAELASADLYRATACFNHALKTGFDMFEPFSVHVLPPTHKAPLHVLDFQGIIRWLIDEVSELTLAQTTSDVIAESLDVLALACHITPADAGRAASFWRFRDDLSCELVNFVADSIDPHPVRQASVMTATPFHDRPALTQTLLLERARLIALMYSTKHVDTQEVLTSLAKLAALCINLCLPSNFSCASELRQHVYNWCARQFARGRDLTPVRSRLQRIARTAL